MVVSGFYNCVSALLKYHSYQKIFSAIAGLDCSLIGSAVCFAPPGLATKDEIHKRRKNSTQLIHTVGQISFRRTKLT